MAKKSVWGSLVLRGSKKSLRAEWRLVGKYVSDYPTAAVDWIMDLAHHFGSIWTTVGPCCWNFAHPGTGGSTRGAGGDETIHGGRDDGSICGDGGGETIHGGRGDESICGGRGGETICGGREKETIRGGGGGETIHGDRDGESVRGGEGGESVRGGGGGESIGGDCGGGEKSGA